jgi:hypothetical protein
MSFCHLRISLPSITFSGLMTSPFVVRSTTVASSSREL